jgi:hypothetical protein
MADKGYDADWFVMDPYAAGGIEVVIPAGTGRKQPHDYKDRQ